MEEAMKCRYGKEHSLIRISSSYDYTNLYSVSVDWCEVCGRVIKTERVLKDAKWEVKNKRERIPQIAKEVLSAEHKELVPCDRDFGMLEKGGKIG